MTAIVSFTLQSATTQSAAPFTIGHAFKKGDVPAGSQLVGSISDLQVVAKNAWPDGSLKFAIVSGRAPLTANTPLTVSLSIGTPAGGTALTTTNLKTTGIVASIGAGAFGSVTWSGTDFDTPWQSWVSGPSMSSWLYRKPIGSDPHLVAFIEVRLYAGGEVNVLPWVENGYLNVASPTNKQDTFTFSLGGTQKFSSVLNFLHHTRSPLVSGTALSYWLGADPGVTPRHDVAYMQATELVPSYSASVVSTARPESLPTTYTPFQAGGFTYGGDSMPSSGYQRPIGLLPTHDVMYLVCSDNPKLVYEAVIRNGYSAGRYPVHYRDNTTGTNRPIKFSDHPMTCVSDGSGVYNNGSTNGDTTPTPTGGHVTWDVAHSPSMGYMAYLLTGRWYFMEEVQFVTTLNYMSRAQPIRGSGANLITPDQGGWQTRSIAWAWRAMVQALTVTPDTDTALRNELITSVQNNIDAFYNTYVAQPNNPYGMVAPSESYDGQNTYQAVWQQDFVTAAFGWSLCLGLPIPSAYQTKLSQFFQWKAKSIVFRLGTSSGFWYINADPYYVVISPSSNPDYLGGTGPWYPDDASVYNRTFTQSSAEQAISNFSWKGTTEGVLCGEYDSSGWAEDLWGNLHPAIAYAVRHGVPGAQAAYTRLTSATNYNAIQTSFTNDPVWSVKPLTQGATVTVTHAIGPAIRFGRMRAGRITISKYHGNGIPASSIPTGFANPALLLNDVDSVNDPAGTVYRLEMAVPTTSTGTPAPFVLNDDSSFSIVGAADGVYTSTQSIYKNGVLAYTSPFSVTVGAPPAATVTMVTVSPLTVSVAGAGTQQFSATVVGTNSPAQTVTWSVTGGGSINSSGLFTAPAATSSAQTITVRATSTVDSSKSGTATVTIPAVAPSTPSVTSVTVSPASSRVDGGSIIQFSATVSGLFNPATTVTWSASAGSIDSTGRWTAPATTVSDQVVTITATSTADTSKSGTASVIVPSFSAPTAPQALSAVAGMETVTVTITPPLSTGGTPITTYLVVASTGQSQSVTGTTATFSLPAFTPVSFTAQAVNAKGPSPVSNPSNTVIPLPVVSTVPADYSNEPAPRERTMRL